MLPTVITDIGGEVIGQMVETFAMHQLKGKSYSK